MEENEEKNVEEKSVVEDFGQNQKQNGEQSSKSNDDNVQKENKYKVIALNYFEKSMSSIKETMRKIDENYQIRKNYPALFHKKFIWIGIILFTIILLSGFAMGRASQASLLEEQDRNINIKAGQISNLASEKSSLKSEIDVLEHSNEIMDEEYTAYKEKMQPYEELEAAEAEARKEELARQKAQAEEEATRKAEEEAAAKVAAEAEAKRIAEEAAAAKAAAAEEAKRQAEEAERIGYETGISYDQLARTPDDYFGQKIKFYGKVVQVIEGSGVINIRFAVDDNYDYMILGEYDSSLVSSRILEDDYITIYGQSMGLYTYESTMGADITIPSVVIDRIDQ